MDEANKYWEQERDRYFKKKGAPAGLSSNAKRRYIHICRLTPGEVPTGQTCEAKVNGIHCVRVPTNLVWYTDPESGNIVGQFVCVDHYAKRMATLLRNGWTESRHDTIPEWYRVLAGPKGRTK